MVPGALRAAVAALALLAMLVQIPHLISTSELRHSQELAQQGSRPDLALAHANDAVAAEPWAGSPFLQRALVLETSGALRSALADATAATDREPTNWRPWLLRARLEAELGRANAALRAYRKARSLNPRSKIFQRTRSQ
jgi:tetratricopeptide (TPR) repeat protein